MNTVMHIPSRASRERILHYCVGICFAPNVMHDIAWSRLMSCRVYPRTELRWMTIPDRFRFGGYFSERHINIAAISTTFSMEFHCPGIVNLVHRRPLTERSSCSALSYLLVTGIWDSRQQPSDLPDRTIPNSSLP